MLLKRPENQRDEKRDVFGASKALKSADFTWKETADTVTVFLSLLHLVTIFSSLVRSFRILHCTRTQISHSRMIYQIILAV